MSTEFATIASMFNTNARASNKATQGVAPDKWLVRPSQNSNPLTWIARHVVVHRALVAKLLGLQWSAPWEQLFVRGAKLAGPEQYPDPAELQRSFGELSEKIAAALPGISEEALRKPVPKEQPSLDGTLGGSVALLCLHESIHVGQMTSLRKCLGYEPAFG